MATDDFNRADLANRGANWVPVSGGRRASIASNEAEANNTDITVEYYDPETPGTSQYSQVVLKAPLEDFPDNSAGCGPAVYIQTGADSGYVCRVNTVAAERFQVWRRIAAAETSIFGYTGAAPAANDVVRLEVSLDGSNDPVLVLKVNSSQVATFTDTDAAALTSGRVGDNGLLANQLSHWDDWEGGDLAAAGGGPMFRGS